MEDSAHAALPTDASIGTGHVAHWCASHGTAKHIGAGDQPGNLVATPALPLQGHPGAVDKGELIHHALGSAHNGVVGTGTWIARGVGDVGNKHHIAVAGTIGPVDDGTAGTRRHMLVQVIAAALVKIDQQWVFFCLIQIFGRHQQPFQLFTHWRCPRYPADIAPKVVFLLRVGTGNGVELLERPIGQLQLGILFEGAAAHHKAVTVFGL